MAGAETRVRPGGVCEEPGNASATKKMCVATKSLSPLRCDSLHRSLRFPVIPCTADTVCLLGLISQSGIKPQIFALVGETPLPNTELFPFHSF